MSIAAVVVGSARFGPLVVPLLPRIGRVVTSREVWITAGELRRVVADAWRGGPHRAGTLGG